MRTMCSTSGKSDSSGRDVDSPVQEFTLPIETLQEDGNQNTETNRPCDKICLPLSQSSHTENCQESSQNPFTSQPPVNVSLTKSSPISLRMGLSKLMMMLLAFCLPIGGSLCQGSSNQVNPIMVCLPGPPHVNEEDKCKKEKEELKPVGLITRIKEADFVGGKFIYGCTCGRKNGLQGECPRLSCQNNPGCSMNPPQCWPQFKEPEKPVMPPDQKMICVPIQLVYYDPSNS